MEKSTTPSDLADHLGFWLRMVSNAVSQGFARMVEREGVTVAEWVFMRSLYGSKEIAPTALASRMGMTRGAISKLANRIERKGLVLRQVTDGRGQALSLTPAAHAKLPRLAALADANDRAFFDVLTDEDRRDLTRILRTLAIEHGLTAPPLD